jgi:hypothetical protein
MAVVDLNQYLKKVVRGYNPETASEKAQQQLSSELLDYTMECRRCQSELEYEGTLLQVAGMFTNFQLVDALKRLPSEKIGSMKKACIREAILTQIRNPGEIILESSWDY